MVPGTSGDNVAFVQRALAIVDGATIDATERSSRHYGPATAAAVLTYKRKRNIVNTAYQTQPDNIVGKMTIAAIDKDLVSSEAGAADFTGFTAAEIQSIRTDIARSRAMLGVTLQRLRAISGTSPGGGLQITPQSVALFDAQLKVLSVFRLNTFRPNDLPLPPAILATLQSTFRGLTIPTTPGDAGDALSFAILLGNFVQLQQAMQATFPKVFFPKGTFKGQSLGFFAAFVDATTPTDATVRFTRLYFDPQIVDGDGRAVTLAHERGHTIFKARNHPGTGDNPFCVAPHLGDPNVTSFNQAIANPYCYEWLIYAMQSDYNAAKHRGPECGAR